MNLENIYKHVIIIPCLLLMTCKIYDYMYKNK